MHIGGIQKTGTDEPISKKGVPGGSEVKASASNVGTEMQKWKTNMWATKRGRRQWDELGDWD